MTKREIAEIGLEFDRNYYEKYCLRTEEQYTYRGQVKTRPVFRLTEEAKRIHNLLDAPVFKCPICGEMVGYNCLEVWTGDELDDLINDRIPCSPCYEEEMGEDL